MEMNSTMTKKEMEKAIKEIPGELGVYALFDKKAKQFDTPIFCRSDMFAGRHYVMVTDTPGTIPNKFKGDFDMYKLGTFKTATGEFDAEIEIIITGRED